MAKQTKSESIPALALIPDIAWGEFGDPGKESGLGFEEYSAVLAGVALNTPGPFTIGVFGNWGTGKTSLMRRVMKRVEESNAVPVWFNAWQFERDENPVVPLIATIIAALKAEESKGKKIAEGLVKALRAVAYGLSMKANVDLKVVSGEIAFSPKDMIDHLGDLSDPLLERSLYYNAFKLLNEATKEGKGSRIVVFIDDLDRCLLDKALFVLEYMKLVLAQPGFIFFLGLDDRIIEGYLDKRFREDYKVTNFSGREYLRKLVQLSFRIPPHHGRIHDFATTCVSRIAASLSDAEKKELEDITPIFGAACKANPRAVIRYLNNLLVDCAIARTNKELAKIPIGMFAVTRALQENWLEVFDLVQKLEKGSELLPHLKAKPGKADTEQAPREDSLVARILAQVEAEEDLKKLLNSEPGHKYLENDDQRQACVEYLVRTRQAEMEITEVQVVKDKRVVMGYVIEPHANLKGADLRRANLEGANLRMADLQRADLEGAILGVANLWGASLRGASLRWADLEGAILEGANLDAADLDGANLDGAYFWGADIRGASLKATSLKGTNLKGTNLRGAVLPASIEDIKKIVKWDENTIWPDGSRG